MLIASFMFAFIFGFGGHIFKLCKGKIVVPVACLVAALFYAKMAVVNPVESRTLDNLKGKDKVSHYPSFDSINKFRFFCVEKDEKC